MKKILFSMSLLMAFCFCVNAQSRLATFKKQHIKTQHIKKRGFSKKPLVKNSDLSKKPKADPTLTKATINLVMGEDHIDTNSTTVFAIHPLGSFDRIVLFKPGEYVKEHSSKTFPMVINRTGVTKEDLKAAWFMIEAKPDGRESYDGMVTVMFEFSDNSKMAWTFDDFSGTILNGSNDIQEFVGNLIKPY